MKNFDMIFQVTRVTSCPNGVNTVGNLADTFICTNIKFEVHFLYWVRNCSTHDNFQYVVYIQN